MKKTLCAVLALWAGLSLPAQLLANEQASTGDKKQNYANSKFVWTDNYVVEGANVAMAPTAEEIVTTVLSKKGEPMRWVRKNDIYKFGKYTGTSTLETALYNMAVDEMINNFEKDGTLRTGLYWGGVWTRDVSYSSLLSLSYMCPDKVRNSLEVKIDRMGRIIQDTGTGGSWPCSSDRVVWALSAWNIYLATGDMEWLQKAYPESDPSWFGFLMTVKPDAGFTRNDLAKHLEAANIQTRNLFAGNIIRHPCFETVRANVDYRIAGELTNTDTIMNSSLWIGLYPGMGESRLDYMVDTIRKFCLYGGES